ncbi:DUF881 domain-containing protein [Trujillonella humicola]|uniref:DUF881 domain-containing protein n=1 Tax=Trujillonella humicola TaxID=3383699 RepID=UPI0039059189
MTAPVRGGGLRAAGASLLDQVLAETLDPAYEQAARAREENPAPSPRRRGGGRLAVALVMVAAGVLAAVTYHLTAVGAEGRQAIRAALVADIGNAQDRADDLAAELEQLRADVSRAREDALAASDEGRQALDELDAAEQMAGTVPVTGPGLLVTLADAAAPAQDDPVGGDAEVDPRGQVRDDDIQLVVNALWAAGAEAVSVNDQRLGPTTAIRFAGQAVLVDFRPVTNPYEIRAIGDPSTLRSAFLTVPEVQSLALIAESYGLTFELAQRDDLSLPAARTPQLRAGELVPVPGDLAGTAPAGEDAPPATEDAPPAGTPPGTAPTPDPGAADPGATPDPDPGG